MSLSALLDDLHQRGLLESTLVVVVGEFGRTPKIDSGGKGQITGRTATRLFWQGPASVAEETHGASDRYAGYVKDRPVLPETFAATIYHALGVAPETRLGADGFTSPASTGQPIRDLFA